MWLGHSMDRFMEDSMQETLASLREAANKARRSGRRRLPDALKRRAVELLGRHTAREVAVAVRVSDGKLVEAWKTRLGSKSRSRGQVRGDEDRCAPSAFVEVPSSALALGGMGDPEIEIELTGDHGRALRIRGRLGAAQLQALVSATLEATGGAPCSK